MGETTKNMMIGLFVIAACAVIIWMILFLKPKVGNGKEFLYVRFSNVNQINIGTRVLFSGKPVGEVIAIQPIPNARNKPIADVLGEIYFYQLVLRVDSSVKVYDTDEIMIQTSGLLGEKSIGIFPKVPPKGVTPKLITGKEPIYADSVDPIEQTFHELSDLSKDMQHAFQQFSNWMTKNGDAVGDTVRSFGCAMDEITETVHNINEKHIIDDVKVAIDNVSRTFQEAHDAIAEMKSRDVFVNAGDLVKNMKDASSSIKTITADIASGKGTLGRLIKTDGLYLQVNSALSKVNTLMNDINNYGLLFNLNKQWQRQRSQRLTVLNALNTPEGFRSYFESEVDQINASMGRLSILLDKAEISPEKEEILGSEQFRKDFSELLRLSDSLSDNLKLYNEQLNESTDE